MSEHIVNTNGSALHVTGKRRLGHELDIEQFVFDLCGVYLTHHVSRRFLADPRADHRAHLASTY